MAVFKAVSTAVLAALLAAALCALSGCAWTAGGGAEGGEAAQGGASGGGAEGGGSPGAVAFTDMAGREVALDAPATRVVALSASDCEILFAIGAGGTIVGRGAYCDYPPEALALPQIESGGETNIEQIIALSPQVAIITVMAQTVEQAEALEKAGIRVVATDAQDIEGTYAAIRLVGMAVGKDDEAEALVASMQEAFEGVREAAARVRADAGEGGGGGEGDGAGSGAGGGEGGGSVYFEVSPLEYGLWTAGAGTFMDELARIAGMSNLFADVDGWAMVSEEQVIARDPDYIVTVAMYSGDGPAPVDEILGRAGWQGVKAVAGKRVYNVGSDAFARPGPRLADAAWELYGLLYGG